MAVIAALLWLHADKIYHWHAHTKRENPLLFKITGFNEKHIDNPEQDIGRFRLCGFGPYPGRCLFGNRDGGNQGRNEEIGRLFGLGPRRREFKGAPPAKRGSPFSWAIFSPGT
jgi:hypothetical protein